MLKSKSEFDSLNFMIYVRKYIKEVKHDGDFHR